MHKTSLFLEGQDFASTRRTLTFAPGSRVQFISIAIIDDVVVEANEQFVCELEAMDETVSRLLKLLFWTMTVRVHINLM